MQYSKIIKNTNPSRTLTDLETALQRGNPVTIDYVDSQGVRTLRTVEPYEITTTQRGRIIVRAMCRLRRELLRDDTDYDPQAALELSELLAAA